MVTRWLQVLGLLLSFFISPVSEVLPCTLFGAIGSGVEGGGVLIAKTRDLRRDVEQVFVDVISLNGYRYQGISTKGRFAVTSGINEKGLVVVSAAASNIDSGSREITTAGKILSEAASVDDVIGMVRKGEIKGPIHYLVGDIHQIGLLEIYDRERYEFLLRREGTLFHTNHFILDCMKAFNPWISLSSLIRLNRAEELLRNGPLNKDCFMAFTRDHSSGSGDHSICRHGKAGSPSGGWTVSAAVYYLPKDGAPEGWYALGRPCQTPFRKY